MFILTAYGKNGPYMIVTMQDLFACAVKLKWFCDDGPVADANFKQRGTGRWIILCLQDATKSDVVPNKEIFILWIDSCA